MATEVGTAYLSIVPSARGFQRALAAEVSGPVGRVGTQAGKTFGGRFVGAFTGIGKNLAATLGTIFAGQQVVSFFSGSINAASDLEESLSKTNVVFGDSAGIVQQFAENAASSLGQSRQQALEASATFGNLFVSMGLNQDAAADMSTGLVQLASDLASFNNVSPEEALQALQSGLVGEIEPLRRFGVALSAAAVEQKALEMGLADSKDELTESDKAQARYALILEQTTTAQGDFARTADGLANQQRILSARWEDAKATLGRALLPAMTTVISFISGTAIPGLFKFRDAIVDVGKFILDNRQPILIIAGLIASIFIPRWIQLGVQAMISAGRQAAAWLVSRASAIGAAAVHSAQVLAMIGRWALLSARSLFHAARVAAAWLIAMGPIGLIIAAVTGLVAVIVANWDKIKDAITKAARAVIDWLKKNWPLVLAILTGPFGLLVKFVIDHWDQILDFIKKLPGRISDLAKGMWDGIVDAFRGAINWIIDAWNRLDLSIGPFSIPSWVPGVGGKTFHIPDVFPDIPRLAEGGIVPATPGGTLALLGEGGEPEAVIPLPDLQRMLPAEFEATLPVDFGEGIERVFTVKFRRTASGLVNRVIARTGAAR